jgi:hypothetical protein
VPTQSGGENCPLDRTCDVENLLRPQVLLLSECALTVDEVEGIAEVARRRCAPAPDFNMRPNAAHKTGRRADQSHLAPPFIMSFFTSFTHSPTLAAGVVHRATPLAFSSSKAIVWSSSFPSQCFMPSSGLNLSACEPSSRQHKRQLREKTKRNGLQLESTPAGGRSARAPGRCR